MWPHGPLVSLFTMYLSSVWVMCHLTFVYSVETVTPARCFVDRGLIGNPNLLVDDA